MDYNFKEIESYWRKYWADNKTFKTEIDPSRPKFYVLDMFPYPSGAGLHEQRKAEREYVPDLLVQPDNKIR